ncbi:FxsB family cyclophane-forming radical SAM/SPASM peptide maturase [Actinoplanes sp. HUAS TT8]|uniref:FxsB family cyclophane-forming radical SAM/SPASM peptide maturase n=1 Tax=Actinoplanes sp. HUAS TT8 TaxID=3447453 RepID=UPI003F52677B
MTRRITAASTRRSLAPTSSPISQFVLKIASRCDLKCDYCYVYEHADQGWRRQPPMMDRAVVATVAGRIAEHARQHRLRTVRVVLHGGEPLLVGPQRLGEIAAELREQIGPGLDLRMQTNGVLLTDEVCAVLREHRIRTGVSLDGSQMAHDRHRRFAHGGGSHHLVHRALALLRQPENRDCYAGLLCTIDLRNDPVQTYRALLAEAPPRIDFLLPHATWDTPPPIKNGQPIPYGTWLSKVFRAWTDGGREVPIRLFEAILAPGAVGAEAVGLSPADLVVVETDGTYEQVDSLKVTYDGAAATGLDVFTSTVDEVAAHPMIAVRQTGLAGLSATCRACEVVDRCGGGQFPHRFRSSNGFDNPSVYCADLKELITSMDDADGLATWVRDELAGGAGRADAAGQLAPIHEALVRARLVTLGGDKPAGWAELIALDESAPDAVREVITHPFVRRADASYLGNVAVAAAVRAGAEIGLELPVRDGLVSLPTLGVLRLPDHPPVVQVRTSAAGFEIDHAGVRQWLPTHRWRNGTIDVALEDADPLRDRYPGLIVSGRVDPSAWRHRLDGAIESLRADAPEYLPGIAATLRAIVPLRHDESGRQRAGSARTAFGAVALTPEEPRALALLLVHEVQHLKLGAVLDVCAMFDPRDRRRIAVPWRDDPRPVEGVLQGTYAFLAVADVWRRRPGPAAAARHAELRGWLDVVLDRLLGGTHLTGAGRRFAAGMRAAVDRW